MYIVIMIEPAHPDEELTITNQINETFGPFETEELVMRWTKDMCDVYGPTREWLIMPLSDPKVILQLSPGRN